MPFLALPSDDSQLRYADDPIVLHYLVSTPECRTFAAAQTHASRLAASLSSSSNLAASEVRREVKLDARYPIVLFLPSECFSVAHLFADQLSDSTLSAHFNLVAVDPRGHGLTREVPIRDPTTRKYDLDIKAADVLAFIRLLLSPYQPANGKQGEIRWAKGIHILACSMSGLVAARMAAQWPDTFTSIMITSPILELESPFMVESFQGIKELLTESWHQQHSQRSNDVRLPGEVVQGFTFRWAGSETIPAHIASYLSRTWLERLVLHHQGLEAARDWWFDLYWLRKPMPEAARCAVRCDLLVVEGDRDLPYDRNVADDIAALFPNARSVHVHKVPRAPFLLSVKRPSQLTDAICSFLGVHPDKAAYSEDASMDALMALEEDERFELVKVYAPQLVPDSDSHADSDDDQDEEQAESDTDPEEAFDSHSLRTKRADTLHANRAHAQHT